MVQDTSVRLVSSGKRLPLPGLNPNSYTYLDSSSDSEDTYLGDETDSEITISRTFFSGKSLPKAHSSQVQTRFSSISPFSSDLEDSELAFPRRRSGKSLKTILNLKKKINFEDLEEEEGEEEIFGVNWECLSNASAASFQDMCDSERQREIRTGADIPIFNEHRNFELTYMPIYTSEAAPPMASVLELTADHLSVSRSPSHSYVDSPTSNTSPNHMLHEVSFTVDMNFPCSPVSVGNRAIDLASSKELLENEHIIDQHSSDISSEEVATMNSNELVAGTCSDNEGIKWPTNTIRVASDVGSFSRHVRYNPYDLKQSSKKIYIRCKGKSGTQE